MADKFTEAFNALADQFPKRYNVKNQKYLKGLVEALAEGDAYINTTTEAVRDNLITVTATSKNLDSLASRYGVVRGQGAGVQDGDFKNLIPLLGMSPKQIGHILLQIIDQIYGPYASHANITCSSPAPYHIIPGTFLMIYCDGKVINSYFYATDFRDPNHATAQEVATAISRFNNGKIIGSVVTNTRTGEEYVNIRTKTIGSQGFIQVIDGDVQKALRFPAIRPTRQGIATWNVTRHEGSDEMTYTAISGVSPGMVAAGTRRGDLITIRLDSGFHIHNTGSFEVTYVGDDSFRLRNGEGLPESNVTQIHPNDFLFYRPDMGNVLLSSRPATVLETGNRELTVLLPVTSPIVKRTLRGGHHFHGGITAAVQATTDTVTVASIAQFPEKDGAIHVISSRIDSRGTCSSVGAGSIILVNAEGWPEQGSAYSPTTQTFYYYSGKIGNTLTGVNPHAPVDLAGSPLKYVERFTYKAIEGNTLTGVYPDPTAIAGQEVAVAGASDGYPGSYFYDPQAPFIAAKESTNITEKLQQGSSKTVLKAKHLHDFPESGYFVLEFNSGEQEGPIRYLSKVGNTALIIDPSHVFDRDHLAGTTIRLVRQIGPVQPNRNGQDLAIYLTSTSPARDLLAQYLQDVVAGGVTLKFNIIVPEQKWAVLPQLYSTNPLATSLV